MTPFDILYYVTMIVCTGLLMSYLYVGVSEPYRIYAQLVWGTGIGYTFFATLQKIYNFGIIPLLEGDYSYILWLLLGALVILRMFGRYEIYGRPAMAVFFGAAMGLTLKGVVYSEVLGLVSGWATTWNMSDPTYIYILLGMICAVSYFIWSARASLHRRGTMGYIPKVGRWLLLLFYGQQFTGITVRRTSEFLVTIFNIIDAFRHLLGVA